MVLMAALINPYRLYRFSQFNCLISNVNGAKNLRVPIDLYNSGALSEFFFFFLALVLFWFSILLSFLDGWEKHVLVQDIDNLT